MSKNSEKTAIVTGASGGIGKAIAETLAKAGMTVFGTSRRDVQDGPKNVAMMVCDVTDEGSVKKLVSDVLDRSGRIDILINNAGIGLFGAAEESTIEQVQALFDVNMYGVIRMSNAVLPSMRRNGGGRIVNISSVIGLIPSPYSAYYAATKHALEGYSQSLDHEVREFDVHVSLIQPAVTQSVFDQNALAADAVLQEYDQGRANNLEVYKDALAQGDPPEVVAQAVLRAVTDARPRQRYTAGKAAKAVSIARRFAPASVFDKSLRKQMGLPA